MLGFGLSSCYHTKPVTYGAPPAAPHPELLNTTAQNLNFQLEDTYDSIKSFQATTEMIATLGSVYRSATVTTYNQSATSYILFRKAADIRIVGKVPLAGSTAFDMVSNGTDFRLSIPLKSLFVTGSDSAPPVPANTLENMRPHELLGALVVPPADLTTERIHIEDDTDTDHSWYILQITRRGPNDTDLPDRSVWFDRINFHVVHQRIFDDKGLIVSDTKYDKWQAFNGVLFPMHIDAAFKKDGYGVVIDTSDLKMNLDLPDDKFALAKPEGYKVQEIK